MDRQPYSLQIREKLNVGSLLGEGTVVAYDAMIVSRD